MNLKLPTLSLRKGVFWPIFGLFGITACIAMVNPSSFLEVIDALNQQMLHVIGPIFSLSALLFLFVVIALYVSPVGKQVIGGASATPLFTKPQWFYVTICTTIATGILFWGASEPIFHLHQPPNGEGLEAGTPETAIFSLSTLFTHWSIIPYGIYTLVSVVFALKFYNEGNRFSLASLFGKTISENNYAGIIDSFALFSLVAGMSASLGAGLLLLNGGIDRFIPFAVNPKNLAILCIIVVFAFIISSVSGLRKGIRWLSNINAKIFFVLAGFVLIFGSFEALATLSFDAFAYSASNFFNQALMGVLPGTDRTWANDWTIFYWTNWLAWTPITALFLARIGVGYSVRTFIRFNLVYPSLFAILWMIIFGGNALLADLSGVNFPLNQILNSEGNGQLVFELIKDYPLAIPASILFLIAVFISYVTAADSNTTAMSALSSNNIRPEKPEAHFITKIAWGLLIGLITWIMVAFSGEGATTGLDGIRILSNLGGLPALIIAYAAVFQAIKWIVKRPVL
jgi:choline-glycine betaine transporter